MTEDEYKTWIKFHRDLFQMKAAADAPMFALWWTSLNEYSSHEAREASLAIAHDPDSAGAFRTQHLALLRTKIQASRFARRRAEFAQLDRMADANRCGLCRGAGCVPVPHPDSIIDGFWAHPFYELAVACNCAKGSHWFNAMNGYLAEKRKSVMDLRTYEAIVPEWLEMQKCHELQREAVHNASFHAQTGDRENPIRAEDVATRLAAIKTEWNRPRLLNGN